MTRRLWYDEMSRLRRTSGGGFAVAVVVRMLAGVGAHLPSDTTNQLTTCIDVKRQTAIGPYRACASFLQAPECSMQYALCK